jgi:dipeptidyl aminopeptidase/acylaminoacyl peptidase
MAGGAGAQTTTPIKPASAAHHHSDDVVVTAARRQAPTAPPPPLEVYAEPPKFEQMALSADGGQVAFITDYKGLRLLVAYRFADKSRRYVKLNPGDISSLSWADNDHVLVSAARSAMRGTCDATDAPIIAINVQAQQAALESVLEANSSTGGIDAQATHDAVSSLLNSVHGHPCVYYGVRAQDAVTSIDLNKASGRSVGSRFGDFQYEPLGVPSSVTLAGKPSLLGAYLERRGHPMADQPTERVYLMSADTAATMSHLVNDGGGDVERVDRYVDDWLSDGQGQLLARTGYDFGAQTVIVQTRKGSGWKTVLSRPFVKDDHTFGPFLIGLGHDDRSVVILDAAPGQAGKAGDRDFHYYQLSFDGQLKGPLEPDDAARDRPLFNPATGRLAGFVQSGETETYALSDPALQSIYQQAQDAAPGENVRVMSVARDPRKLIIYAQGRDDPGSYYYIDYTTGQSTTIGEDYADVPTDWIAAQDATTYTTADGREIHALLTLPPKPEAKNLPLIVLPHDGLEAHDGLSFDWLAQALASRGYVVLQPNVRGSDGYGRDYMAAGQGQLGRKMQSDLSDGVRTLVAEGLVDPKRVCVMGVGYGGYAALEGAASEPGVYRCAIAINGVSDPKAYANWLKDQLTTPDQDKTTTLAADPHWERGFIVNPTSPQILADYMGAEGLTPSPDKQADAATAPVLLIHARHDKTVPFQQSQLMRDALKAHGGEADLVELPGGDHALATQAARLATLTAALDFLAKHNPAN